MRRKIVVTDVTRMQAGRVCVAGSLVDGAEAGRSVRPELRYGRPLLEGWLGVGDRVVVSPFAIVELDLQEHRPHPPHTEDWIVDERHRRRCGTLGDDERRALLTELDDGSVAGIFGATVHEGRGWYVLDGEGARSLGTVEAARVSQVFFEPKSLRGGWNYRLAFADAAGRAYNLAVTDLAYRYYLDYLRDVEELEPPRVARHVLATLRQAEHVFLRVGLARGWSDEAERRCHLQINGVYAFPDLLGGRCFADLAPDAGYRYDPREVPF